MFDKEIALLMLNDIEKAIELALSQSGRVLSPSSFTDTQEGVFLMGGVCMQLIYIGEKVKVLDQKTENKLLASYPQIPWKAIKGMRNIIVHEYHNVDEDEIFNVLKNDLPELQAVVQEMKRDICAE